MMISDEQRDKFGKTCKWLDYDCYCHKTKCILNWAKREVWFEKFQEKGYKHPEFAYDMFSDSCSTAHDSDWKCFDGNEKPKFSIDSEDDDYLTALEQEALEIVKKDMEKMSDSWIENTYKAIRDRHIQNRKEEIAEELKELDRMSKEM